MHADVYHYWVILIHSSSFRTGRTRMEILLIFTKCIILHSPYVIATKKLLAILPFSLKTFYISRVRNAINRLNSICYFYLFIIINLFFLYWWVFNLDNSIYYSDVYLHFNLLNWTFYDILYITFRILFFFTFRI